MYSKLFTTVVIGLVLLVVPPALTLRYSIHSTRVIYFEALTRCIKNGGHLAAIEIAYQQTQIWNAIQKAGLSTGTFWTAGTDLGMEGAWLWLSRNKPVGSVQGWTNWMDGEPNNAGGTAHCLAMVGGTGNGQWGDFSCESVNHYVCEYAD
ncbi:perlucin-like [Anopheles maculipalpis]|uniref:perlucin-like n=1 Tax=Anopheles maculipalpis TaxID=1496333 RepID=UPI0021591F4F|nr:perlucin-like [Anopheles maculipalpis]